MSTFIIAFIIFASAGLGIRHYIKGKGYAAENWLLLILDG